MQRVCVCTCLPVNAPMVAVLSLTVSQVLLGVIITAVGCDAVPDRLAPPVTAEETWPGPTGQSVQSRGSRCSEVLVSVHCAGAAALARFHQVSLWPGWLFAALLSVLIPLAVGAVLFFRMRKPQPRGGRDSGG